MFVLCVISCRVQSLRTLRTHRHSGVARFTVRYTSGQKCGYVYKHALYAPLHILQRATQERCRGEQYIDAVDPVGRSSHIEVEVILQSSRSIDFLLGAEAEGSEIPLPMILF